MFRRKYSFKFGESFSRSRVRLVRRNVVVAKNDILLILGILALGRWHLCDESINHLMARKLDRFDEVCLTCHAERRFSILCFEEETPRQIAPSPTHPLSPSRSQARLVRKINRL